VFAEANKSGLQRLWLDPLPDPALFKGRGNSSHLSLSIIFSVNRLPLCANAVEAMKKEKR